MKAELWKKIDELFAAAQAQPAGERAAFLDRVCEGDKLGAFEIVERIERGGIGARGDSRLRKLPSRARFCGCAPS
jgi:hypothetical protein